MTKDDAQYLSLEPGAMQNLLDEKISRIREKGLGFSGFSGQPLTEVKEIGVAQIANTRATAYCTYRDRDNSIQDRFAIGYVSGWNILGDDPVPEYKALDDEKQILTPKEKYVETKMVNDSNKIDVDLDKSITYDSGATALQAFYEMGSGLVTYGNSGDSRIILLTKEEESVKVELKNELHTLSNQRELNRVNTLGNNRKLGARLASGIEVSRSWGDHAHRGYGLVATPQVGSFRVDAEKDQYLLLCTDGFNEAVLAQKHSAEFQQCLLHIFENDEEVLPAKALRLGQFAKQKGSHDDILCILVRVVKVSMHITPLPTIMICVYDGHKQREVAQYAQELSVEYLQKLSITQEMTLFDALEEKSSGKLKFLLEEKSSDPLLACVPHQKCHVDEKSEQGKTALETVLLIKKWRHAEKIAFIRMLLRYGADTTFMTEKRSAIFDEILLELRTEFGLAGSELFECIKPYLSRYGDSNLIFLYNEEKLDLYHVNELNGVECKAVGDREKAIFHFRHHKIDIIDECFRDYDRGCCLLTQTSRDKIQSIRSPILSRVWGFTEINSVLSRAREIKSIPPLKIQKVTLALRKCCAHPSSNGSIELFGKYLTSFDETEEYPLRKKLQIALQLERIKSLIKDEVAKPHPVIKSDPRLMGSIDQEATEKVQSALLELQAQWEILCSSWREDTEKEVALSLFIFIIYKAPTIHEKIYTSHLKEFVTNLEKDIHESFLEKIQPLSALNKGT